MRNWADSLTIDIVKAQTRKLAERAGFVYKDGEYTLGEKTEEEQALLKMIKDLDFGCRTKSVCGFTEGIIKHITGREINLSGNKAATDQGFFNFSLVIENKNGKDTGKFVFIFPNITNNNEHYHYAGMYDVEKLKFNYFLVDGHTTRLNEGYRHWRPATDKEIVTFYQLILEQVTKSKDTKSMEELLNE
jgi:hypothetical protein